MATNTPPAFPSLKLTLPELLDFHYTNNPDFPLYLYAEDGADEVTKISCLEFVRASHRAGKAVLGDRSPSPQREVIAIIAQVDTIVYQALNVGLMKAGFTPFPISPRNSPTAIVNLLRTTSAHRLLTTHGTLNDLVESVKSELSLTHPDYALTIEEAPSLNEIFPKLGKETLADPFAPLPALKPDDFEVALYLHSSGSTGLPKAIPWTFISIKDYAESHSVLRFRNSSITRQNAMAFPAFHAYGLSLQLNYGLYTPLSNVVFPPVVVKPDALPVVPTPENIIRYVDRTQTDFLIIVPTFLHVWAQSPECVKTLISLKAVCFGGGPLSSTTGDFLVSQGVNLCAGYGGTEFGAPTAVRFDERCDKDWLYLRFSDRVQVRWLPRDDGNFECQVLASDRYHLGVENLPDMRGYATLDVFEPHPTRDGLWKIVGRADDVLIHSSGEKTVPAPMESIISSSPLIKGAIMFGRQRDQAGILIEPYPGEEVDVSDFNQVSQFRNKIWPVIDEANKIAPNFSRIFKEMILITSPNKPLPRVAKGTISRKAALQVYEEEINKLYETIESNSGGEEVVPPKSWSDFDLRGWLSTQASDILSKVLTSESGDIFEQGFDSLAATMLRLRITSALRKANDSDVKAVVKHINQTTVYSYPTIESLAAFIVGLLHGESSENSHEAAIEKMIEKYSQGLDTPIAQSTHGDEGEKAVVLLTGSTGNLGAQMLESLLRKDSVARVYALNRPSKKMSMFDRHRERFEDKALDVGLLSSEKLVFLEGDTSQSSLGLPESMLEELRENMTMIIHNAWRLDFNLSLSSFESNIRGSRSLIDLARSSRHGASIRYLFTSSIGSTQSWDKAKGPYPEEVVTDARSAVGAGYGESKYIVERILAKSGIHATSFRIGQISGGWPNGAWAITDWFPILVKSSVALGMLPNAHGLISWIPMDAVSDAILEVGFAKHAPLAVNVVHPRPVSWTSIIEAIRSTIIREKELSGDALRLVSFQEWFAEVQKRAEVESEKVAQEIPAVKLVDFFRTMSAGDEAIGLLDESSTMESTGLTPLSTVNVQRLSPRMKNLEPLEPLQAERWVRYWIQCGL